MLHDNPRGNYRFSAGIAPYSSGVVAAPGYEIIHVTLRRPLPYLQGFDLVARHLEEKQRPQQALCAVKLRLPAPLSFAGFAAFNGEYQRRLDSWDLMVDGRNPIARTNVAPVLQPPAEPSLYGFAYTMRAAIDVPASFVVAGAGELRDQADLSPAAIVRPQELSTAALRQKAATVMQVMAERVESLGVEWADATVVNIYTAQALHPFLVDTILESIGAAVDHGVHWHYANPPIDGLVYEMDLRGVQTEITIG